MANNVQLNACSREDIERSDFAARAAQDLIKGRTICFPIVNNSVFIHGIMDEFLALQTDFIVNKNGGRMELRSTKDLLILDSDLLLGDLIKQIIKAKLNKAAAELNFKEYNEEEAYDQFNANHQLQYGHFISDVQLDKTLSNWIKNIAKLNHCTPDEPFEYAIGLGNTSATGKNWIYKVESILGNKAEISEDFSNPNHFGEALTRDLVPISEAEYKVLYDMQCNDLEEENTVISNQLKKYLVDRYFALKGVK